MGRHLGAIDRCGQVSLEESVGKLFGDLGGAGNCFEQG